MDFKIPSDLADIGNNQKFSGIRGSQITGVSNLKQKRKMKGFQTLPKLENISYSSQHRNTNDDLQSTHRRRHTKAELHHKKPNHHSVYSKPHQPRHKRRNNRRHNRRHNPQLLRDIANDQPVAPSGMHF